MARTYKALAALISYPTEALQAATDADRRSPRRGGLRLLTPTRRHRRPFGRTCRARHLRSSGAGISLCSIGAARFPCIYSSTCTGKAPTVVRRWRTSSNSIAATGSEPTAGELPDFLPPFLEFFFCCPRIKPERCSPSPRKSFDHWRTGSSRATVPMPAVFVALAAMANAPNGALPDIEQDNPDDLAALDVDGRRRPFTSAQESRLMPAEPTGCGRAFARPPGTPRLPEEKDR